MQTYKLRWRRIMRERSISDPDLRLLVSIAGSLEPDYRSQDDDWATSPFGWIKRQPSRTVGKIGEQIVAGWCAAKGFDVTAAPNSDSDRVIGGLRTEIKFSTLWKGGFFKFQQIRDQNYDVVFCLGLSPFDAHCWIVPKYVLQDQPPGVQPQHGGQAGTDTLWLQVRPGSTPAWLHEWGGDLADGYAVLRRLTATNLGSVS